VRDKLLCVGRASRIKEAGRRSARDALKMERGVVAQSEIEKENSLPVMKRKDEVIFQTPPDLSRKSRCLWLYAEHDSRTCVY